MQALADGDGKAVHHRAEGGPFLVHVDENLAERAIRVFARAQVDLLAPDARFDRETLAAVRQAAAQRGRRLERHRLLRGLLDLGDHLAEGRADLFLLLVLVPGGAERLAHFAAVAIERDGLEPHLPAIDVDGADILDRGLIRQVDRLADRAGDERLRGLPSAGHGPSGR